MTLCSVYLLVASLSCSFLSWNDGVDGERVSRELENSDVEEAVQCCCVQAEVEEWRGRSVPSIACVCVCVCGLRIARASEWVSARGQWTLNRLPQVKNEKRGRKFPFVSFVFFFPNKFVLKENAKATGQLNFFKVSGLCWARAVKTRLSFLWLLVWSTVVSSFVSCVYEQQEK